MKSKKKVIAILVLAMFLFICSFAVIIVCGTLQEKGYGDFWWPLCGIIGFLACNIASLALIFHIFGDVVYYDMAGTIAKYEIKKMTELCNMSKAHVCEIFTINNFKETEKEYFRKKIFSFMKESICYYMKCIDSDHISESIENVIEKEFKQMDKTGKNVCLFLFVYKENVTQAEIDMIKEISKLSIIYETGMPRREYETSIVILVDSQTDKGYFLDMNSRTGISVYAYGCRLLKKYFKCRGKLQG